MRYLSYFLGFSLLILTHQTALLRVAPPGSLSSLSPDYLVAQNYDNGYNYLNDESSSPPRGSDRRDG